MYLTFDDYKSYGGTLDETTFNEYGFEAESIINYWTFNRMVNDTDISENVKRCMYALIKLAKQRADALTLGSASSDGSASTSAAITSQSNDGVSITYNALSASELFSASKVEMDGMVQRYLQGVRNSLGQLVLYRGIYSNE